MSIEHVSCKRYSGVLIPFSHQSFFHGLHFLERNAIAIVSITTVISISTIVTITTIVTATIIAVTIIAVIIIAPTTVSITIVVWHIMFFHLCFSVPVNSNFCFSSGLHVKRIAPEQLFPVATEYIEGVATCTRTEHLDVMVARSHIGNRNI